METEDEEKVQGVLQALIDVVEDDLQDLGERENDFESDDDG